METKPDDIATNPLVILNGGVEIEVTRLDGTPDLVKVRQLPLRHMAKYGDIQGDEGKIIELVTGKDAAWVDGLALESQEEIVILADRLNLDPFLRWSMRRLTSTDHLKPLTSFRGVSEKLQPPSVPAAATRPSSSNG